jgi:hypothetical protein
MSLPFNEQQCFFFAILVFVFVGFQRGWRRELISLVAVLLAVFLVRPDTGQVFLGFLSRLVGSIVYIFNPQGAATTSSTLVQPATPLLGGPLGALLIFAGLMALGYFVGNKAFPKPTTPHERFIGIVPGVVSGAFVLAFLRNFLTNGGTNSQGSVSIAVAPPDPASYVSIIFVIAIIAVVIALITARARKAPVKK